MVSGQPSRLSFENRTGTCAILVTCRIKYWTPIVHCFNVFSFSYINLFESNCVHCTETGNIVSYVLCRFIKKYLLQAWYSWLSPVLLTGEPFPPEFTPDSFIPLGRAFLLRTQLYTVPYCFFVFNIANLYCESVFQANPDPWSGSRVWWPKIERNIQLKNVSFLSRIVIYLSFGLHKRCPSYSRP